MLITMHRTTIKTRQQTKATQSFFSHIPAGSGGAATKNRPNNHHNSLPPSIFPYQRRARCKSTAANNFRTPRGNAALATAPRRAARGARQSVQIWEFPSFAGIWRLPAVDWARNRRPGL